MFRYAQVAALLAPLLSTVVAQTGDFAWDITPVENWPQIAFDATTSESEVMFRYAYTGTLDENKYLSAALFQADCTSPAENSLNVTNFLITGSELDLDLDIIQSTITDSVHYSPTSATTANIDFCLRVDYNYKNALGDVMSVNFHETKVDITVDLTANFTLTGITTDRTAADEDAANADLDYPVEAYFCNDVNGLIVPAPFAQGSSLQVCVKIDDTVVTEEVYVDDILSFVVSQPAGPEVAGTPNVLNGSPDPLTEKACGLDGICNVKTMLPSRYFVDPIPNDLQVDGIALLSFGTPARKLKATIRGSIKAHNEDALESVRALQDSAANSPFSLQAGLIGNDLPESTAVAPIAPIAVPVAPAQPTPVQPCGCGNSTISVAVAVAAVFITLIIVGGAVASMYFCCGVGAAAGGRRNSNSSRADEDFERELRMRRYAEKMGMNYPDNHTSSGSINSANYS